MERFEDLNMTLIRSWDQIFRAAQGRNDAMRTPVLATFDGKKIHQRTIVLRKVNVQNRILYYFSDYRAPKIQHLQVDPQLNVVFYSAKKKLQIEASGIGIVAHQDERCRSFWQQINVQGRQSYATDKAPGSLHLQDEGFLTKDWPKNDSDLSQTEWAFANFALIEMHIDTLDVLHLHQDGHQRARFDWENGEWNGHWVVP